MSAEAIGNRLLSEVKEERLDEALQLLRSTNTRKCSNTLGIKPLDRLLDICRGATGNQDASNTLSTHDRPECPSSPLEQQFDTHTKQSQLKPAVIEITGTSSCSGKTHLLYYITAISALPASFRGCDLHGKEAAVVVFDTDGRFNVHRLQQIMSYHVQQHLGEQGDVPEIEKASFADELEDLLHSALRHVHIFRPQSSASWLLTIESLPKYLLQSKDHFSSGRPLSAILVDSPDPDHSSLQSNLNKVYQNLVTGLRHLQLTFDCTIVATNWGLVPLSQSRPHAPPSFKPHLPSAWTNFCTMRLIVERDLVAKFGPFMSAEEASLDADARQRKVEKGGFSAWIDFASGSEVWNESTRRAIKSVEGKGFVWFTITKEGLEMKS